MWHFFRLLEIRSFVCLVKNSNWYFFPPNSAFSCMMWHTNKHAYAEDGRRKIQNRWYLPQEEAVKSHHRKKREKKMHQYHNAMNCTKSCTYSMCVWLSYVFVIYEQLSYFVVQSCQTNQTDYRVRQPWKHNKG